MITLIKVQEVMKRLMVMCCQIASGIYGIPGS